MRSHHISYSWLIVVGILSTVCSSSKSAVISNWEYDQVKPRAVYNSDTEESLVVWEDHHWGWGEARDIYARRVDNSGAGIGGSFAVAWESSNPYLSPDVTWNSAVNEYLVTWEYEYSSSDHDIYCRRISHSGSLTGDEIPVATSTNNESHPAVTFNPLHGHYLVIWERQEGSGEFTHNNIYGQRFDSSATPVGSVIIIASTSIDESRPSVASDTVNGGYLIAWHGKSDSTGDYGIYAQRISSDGSLSGSRITVSNWEYDQLKPRVVFNGSNEFLIIWEDHHWGWGLDSDIYGQRVNTSGGLVGINFGISWLESNLRLNPDVSYDTKTNEYLAAWEYEYDSSDHDVYIRRIQIDASLPGNEIAISSLGSMESTPTVISNNNSKYLVFWEDGRDSGTSGLDIYADQYSPLVFSGTVFAGEPGIEELPIEGVTVSVYGSSDSGQTGTLLASTVTSDDGSYKLITEEGWEFYNIIENDLTGFISVGAGSIDGTIINNNWIQYSVPLGEKTLTDNKFWDLYDVPLVITEGPTLSETGPDYAVVSWQTNDESDSVVLYGRTASFEFEAGNSIQTTSHQVTLSGLEASTTYHYVAQSTNPYEMHVRSRDIVFETASVPDSEDPLVSIPELGTVQDEVVIAAQATDNISVEKVEFYLDDDLLYTDYSSDYEFTLNSKEHNNGSHTLTAKVYDQTGRVNFDQKQIDVYNIIDATIPEVEFMSHSHGETVSGEIGVWAHLFDDTGLQAAFFTVDGACKDYTGGPEPQWLPPVNGTFASVKFMWDSTTVANGAHTIGILVVDVEGKIGTGAITLYISNIPPQEPKLVISDRKVYRNQNKFTMELTVKNTGTGNATNVDITDKIEGFQALKKSDSTADYAPCFYSYTPPTGPPVPTMQIIGCCITGKVDIPAGGSQVYSYEAMPVLENPEPVNWYPKVGSSITIRYEDLGGTLLYDTVKYQVNQTQGAGESIPTAYSNALKSSDYLIITHPGRLISHNTKEATYSLLTSLGQLAYLKQGVLGYGKGFFGLGTITKLIQKGGAWSNKLPSNWTSNGYLLIVGETEIIPAGCITVGWGVWPFYKDSRTVHASDLFYANSVGHLMYPEINVGRIIGNTTKALNDQVDTIIKVAQGATGYNSDRSHALVVSGAGSGVSYFESNVDDVGGTLDDEFIVAKLKLTEVQDAGQDMLQQFKNNITDQDVIFYRDHGSINSWSGVVNTGDFVTIPPDPGIDFGNTKPFAYASCCNSGAYENIYGIAEAFLDNGAIAYLGSTEKSERLANNTAGRHFFKKWVNSSKSVGQVLKELKRDLAKSDFLGPLELDPISSGISAYFEFGKRLWLAENNLYGDPKYGLVSGSSPSQATQNILSEPVSSLEIVVPDYTVETIDGYDHIEIPGGNLLLEPNMPIVPIYSVSVEYSQEFQVQDVILLDRFNMIPQTGLNIAPLIPAWDSSEPITMGLDEAICPEMWPFEHTVFSWNIIEMAEGNSTLVITVAPFYYFCPTGESMFYKNYNFEIVHIESGLEIEGLLTDKPVYEVGEEVDVTIEFNDGQTGQIPPEGQDIVVEALVKSEGIDQNVSSLLLETLKDFRGKASFAPIWNSGGMEPGSYAIEVFLKDIAGNILERKIQRLMLGVISGRIINFSAIPDYFDTGQNVAIAMEFQNTGSTTLNGTARIKIVNTSGHLIAKYNHAITDLAPEDSVHFNDLWNVTESGPCKAVGYALFNSTTTPPITLDLNKCENGVMAEDINRDCYVNLIDLGFLASRWLDTTCNTPDWCERADINQDYNVGFSDLVMLANHWLWCNDPDNLACGIY